MKWGVQQGVIEPEAFPRLLIEPCAFHDRRKLPKSLFCQRIEVLGWRHVVNIRQPEPFLFFASLAASIASKNDSGTPTNCSNSRTPSSNNRRTARTRSLSLTASSLGDVRPAVSSRCTETRYCPVASMNSVWSESSLCFRFSMSAKNEASRSSRLISAKVSSKARRSLPAAPPKTRPRHPSFAPVPAGPHRRV